MQDAKGCAPFQEGGLLDEKGKIKSRYWIKEHKRGKRHEIMINQSILETLTEYLGEYQHIAKGVVYVVEKIAGTCDLSGAISEMMTFN